MSMSPLIFALLLGGSMFVPSSTEPEIDARLRVSRSSFTVNRKFVYVREHSSVTLQCNPDADITTEGFVWHHNGPSNPIYKDETYDPERDAGLIYINKMSDVEQGPYNCLVNTSNGRLLSETVILKLAKTEKPPLGYGVNRLNGMDPLPCDVTAYSVPRGEITWLKSETKLDPSETENVYINMNGALVFVYLTSDDFNKPYKCEVHNNVLHENITGNTTYLKEGTWNSRSQTKPKLITSTGTTSAAEGDDVILECVFGGDPAPTVTWTRRHAREARHKYSYPATKGSQLRIADVALSDGGEYRCQAKNPPGEAEATVTVNIKKKPALLFPNSVESRFLVAGDNVTYNCIPDSGLESRWLFDGTSLDDGTEQLLLGNNKKSLTITSTRSDREGICVQCNVSNDIAYTLYSACVRYVATEADLPTTTMIINTQDPSTLSTFKLWWVLNPVVIVTAVVIIIAVVVVSVRRRRANEKKRLSTVGSTVDLPNKASIYWEAHQLIEQTSDKGRIAQVAKKQQQDDLWNEII
ncbi:hemicentin-2-like [Haliotis rufescens]|uniref:hemicentin-2-like n=1 Tax=Haliotis rufescens TaxID=6454 RepID=UPI00201EB388|nr:hemicentin-2-like [Haliotis rufescens]XP_048248213.1 hemicentin-2-like [Haliotis rufescens]